MKRDLTSILLRWKDDQLRMPLILRGARQVGKSWLVQDFSKHFSSFVELNFDIDEDAKLFFEGKIEIKELLNKIGLYTGTKIEIGETLLFLDEIQECPRALKMLRYFKEKCPELHVIAAGSLIEFQLEKIGVPVGRVQFLHCHPLSFAEFLTVSGRNDLREYIKSTTIDPVIHTQILEYLKNYMWLGGMPAVVDAWLKYSNPQKCQSLQDMIITAYRQDFLKYARKNQIHNIEKVFLSIPYQFGNKFKYSIVDNEIKSASIATALNLLSKADIAYFCYHTPGQGMPLSANRNEKHFKIFFFDIGLAQRIMGLDLRQWVVDKVDNKYIGAVTEQLVAQEYVAHSNPEKPCELYYWHREHPGCQAEVDFLFLKNNTILPAEVKSNTKGSMKSLQIFLDSHKKSPYGIKISRGVKQKQEKLQEISLYGLEAWFLEN